MRRIRLTIEYDGTAYGGWQRQSNATTVQQLLEDNLLTITGERASVVGSGRTDSGVHALAQVAHFDTNARMEAAKFALALNAGLPRDIRVHGSEEVPTEFHARFGAKSKHYRYVIDNAAVASAMMRHFRLHVHVPLDEGAMRRGAEAFCGTHDFASFMAAGTTIKDTVRRVTAAGVKRAGDVLVIDVTGNGFLYNMVRIFTGTLIEMGSGKRDPGEMGGILLARDRAAAGPTAPAHGLTLVSVEYV